MRYLHLELFVVLDLPILYVCRCLEPAVARIAVPQHVLQNMALEGGSGAGVRVQGSEFWGIRFVWAIHFCLVRGARVIDSCRA